MDTRLTLATSFATENGFAVDVGTDHGYLACGLVESGRSAFALATDIREGPLSAARKTIEKRKLGGKVSLLLADGLVGVDLSDKSDIFICGMGGLLISEIIEKRHPVTQNLVLQPMTRADDLRRWLCQNGYRIVKEKAAWENGKAYTVLNCRYDGVVRDCSPLYALVGELAAETSVQAEKYFAVLRERLEKKARGLASSQGGEQEREELLLLIKQMEELKK